jgi:uncharacterized UPF0160 family protein
MNERFRQASELATSEFVQCLLGLARSWWPARSIVSEAVEKRFSLHPSGSILLFDTACPWKEHLFDIEAEIGTDKSILYVLYQDLGGSWRVQAVPVDPTSFSSRKKLPEEWCGLRDQELSDKTGLPGCIFIHASGFIGGHATKEGALQLAIKVL